MALTFALRQGDLDSVVNLLLYGTSFTKQPRIRVEALTEASKAGTLRARVADLVAGLRSPGDNDRLNFLNTLLHSQGVDPSEPGETGVFIYSNLQRVVQEMGKASTSALQRRLRVGYGRAASLLDAMERNGIVGPPDGSRPREVLIGRAEDFREE